jgi:hypothetical protein
MGPFVLFRYLAETFLTLEAPYLIWRSHYKSKHSDSSLPLAAEVIEVLNPDLSLALTFSYRTKLRIEIKKNNG